MESFVKIFDNPNPKPNHKGFLWNPMASFIVDMEPPVFENTYEPAIISKGLNSSDYRLRITVQFNGRKISTKITNDRKVWGLWSFYFFIQYINSEGIQGIKSFSYGVNFDTLKQMTKNDNDKYHEITVDITNYITNNQLTLSKTSIGFNYSLDYSFKPFEECISERLIKMNRDFKKPIDPLYTTFSISISRPNPGYDELINLLKKQL